MGFELSQKSQGDFRAQLFSDATIQHDFDAFAQLILRVQWHESIKRAVSRKGCLKRVCRLSADTGFYWRRLRTHGVQRTNLWKSG